MIVAVGGWRGVGTTTAALVLGACLAAREGRAWLIEADPAGGTLVGRVDVAEQAIGGLERVAFPSERLEFAAAMSAVAHPLGGLSIVSAPADPFRASACHQPRVPWQAALDELGGPVVVDVGRLRAGTVSWDVVRRADRMLLVTAAEVSALVGAVDWLHLQGRVSAADAGLGHDEAALLVVDSPAGVGFERSVVEHDLPGRVAAWLPWEPWAVELVHRGLPPTDRRLRRSGLLREADRAVATLMAAEEVR